MILLNLTLLEDKVSSVASRVILFVIISVVRIEFWLDSILQLLFALLFVLLVVREASGSLGVLIVVMRIGSFLVEWSVPAHSLIAVQVMSMVAIIVLLAIVPLTIVVLMVVMREVSIVVPIVIIFIPTIFLGMIGRLLF